MHNNFWHFSSKHNVIFNIYSNKQGFQVYETIKHIIIYDLWTLLYWGEEISVLHVELLLFNNRYSFFGKVLKKKNIWCNTLFHVEMFFIHVSILSKIEKIQVFLLLQYNTAILFFFNMKVNIDNIYESYWTCNNISKIPLKLVKYNLLQTKHKIQFLFKNDGLKNMPVFQMQIAILLQMIIML